MGKVARPQVGPGRRFLREERGPARFFGHLLEDLVAGVGIPVGRVSDGVNSGLRRVRHRGHFIKRMLALDVDAVAQDDKHAAALFRRTGLQHLFPAGVIDRIIERLPASCLQGPDLLVQRLGIVSKILEH